MKTYLNKILIVFLLIGIVSCQKEEEEDVIMDDETLIESKIESLNQLKSNADYRLVCSIDGIPSGYRVEEYLNFRRCPNINLFLGRFNAAIVSKINDTNERPVILRAGPGCDDNYCIWIIGKDFENGAYVNIKKAYGSNIIGTYRGPDRTFTIKPDGTYVITLRLRSQLERNEFSRGLRVSVVNPIAGKTSNEKRVRRPGGIIIDPPCNPICP